MEKTVGMYRLEEERGQDIRQIIWDAVHRHGSVGGAATEFGMSRQGLSLWIEALDGHVDTRTAVEFDDWTPAEATQEAAVA